MGSHVFHDIYLHFNWHTQGDKPLLTPEIEPRLYAFLRKRSARTPGVFFLGIGGTATHVHLLVKMEPSICPSDLVGDLKGASARQMNAVARRQVVRWQRGFGVVSFARRNLQGMLRYVEQQKEHHARETLKDALERAEFDARVPEGSGQEAG